MHGAATEASAFLKALAHQHRLLILCHLIDRERTVGQLAAFLGIRDSTASQHLAVLRRDGLVAGRRDGQTIWYRIIKKPARDVVQVLYAAFCSPGTQPEKPKAAQSKRSGKKTASHKART